MQVCVRSLQALCLVSMVTNKQIKRPLNPWYFDQKNYFKNSGHASVKLKVRLLDRQCNLLLPAHWNVSLLQGFSHCLWLAVDTGFGPTQTQVLWRFRSSRSHFARVGGSALSLSQRVSSSLFKVKARCCFLRRPLEGRIILNEYPTVRFLVFTNFCQCVLKTEWAEPARPTTRVSRGLGAPIQPCSWTEHSAETW